MNEKIYERNIQWLTFLLCESIMFVLVETFRSFLPIVCLRYENGCQNVQINIKQLMTNYRKYGTKNLEVLTQDICD